MLGNLTKNRYPSTMTKIVEPKPQFLSCTEAEIMTALNDPDPANPIAQEVARLIEGYTANFQRHVERLGYMPASVLRVKARWPHRSCCHAAHERCYPRDSHNIRKLTRAMQ